MNNDQQKRQGNRRWGQWRGLARLTSPTKSSTARTVQSDSRNAQVALSKRDSVAEKAKRDAKLKSSQASSRLTAETASSRARSRDDELQDTKPRAKEKGGGKSSNTGASADYNPSLLKPPGVVGSKKSSTAVPGKGASTRKQGGASSASAARQNGVAKGKSSRSAASTQNRAKGAGNKSGQNTSAGMSNAAVAPRNRQNAESDQDSDDSSAFSDSSSDSSTYVGRPPSPEKDRSELFTLVCHSRWRQVIDRVRNFPHETEFIDRNGFNCLHIVVRLIPPIDFSPNRFSRQLTPEEQALPQLKLHALRDIIEARPGALAEQDSNLWTPMHVAVRAVAPEALFICAEETLEPFEMKTIMGLTPLQVIQKDADPSIKQFIKHTMNNTPMPHERELTNYMNEMWRKFKFCLYIKKNGSVPPQEVDDDMQWALEYCAGWPDCTSTIFHFILVNSFHLNGGKNRTLPQSVTNAMLDRIAHSFAEAQAEELRLMEARVHMGELECDKRCENGKPTKLQIEFCGLTEEQLEIDRFTEVKHNLGEGPAFSGWPIEKGTLNMARKAKLLVDRFPDCASTRSVEHGEWALEIVGQGIDDHSPDEQCQIVRSLLVGNPTALADIETVSLRSKVKMLSLLSTVDRKAEFPPDDLYYDARYQALRQMPHLAAPRSVLGQV